MVFAHKTRHRAKAVLTGLVVYSMLTAALAVMWPKQGVAFAEATSRWFVGIPATIAMWLALEWLGSKALGLPLWSRLPSWARIALLVVVVVAATLGAFAVSVWWQGKNAA